MEYYDVQFEKQVAGKVAVEKEGLYYRFSCQCRLPQTGIYRLVAKCPEGEIPLGILVPESGKFVLNTSIPVKRFGAVPKGFTVISDKSADKTKFIPLHPDEPFAHISDLPGAKLSWEGSQPGIIIPSV